MKHERAAAIAGAIRVQAAPSRITDTAHQFRILATKNRGERNGIPDCSWRRGDDGTVCCDHRWLFETAGVVTVNRAWEAKGDMRTMKSQRS
jgi:hypothetical protein